MCAEKHVKHLITIQNKDCTEMSKILHALTTSKNVPSLIHDHLHYFYSVSETSVNGANTGTLL